MPVEQAPLRVDLFGFNPRQKASMTLLLEGPGAGCAVIATAATAQAVMVDLDSPISRRDWPDYQAAHPDRPIIVFAMRESACVGTVVAVVQKPYKAEAVVNAVCAAQTALPNPVRSADLPARRRPVADPTSVLDAGLGEQVVALVTSLVADAQTRGQQEQDDVDVSTE